MIDWKKPDVPLNIWDEIDIIEKLDDGRSEKIRIRIQDVPNNKEKREEAIRMMITDFIVDEPMCKCLGMLLHFFIISRGKLFYFIYFNDKCNFYLKICSDNDYFKIARNCMALDM